MDEIFKQSYNAVKELIEVARLKSGNILVVGCSTSEVCGSRIGTNSNEMVASSLFDGIYAATNEKGVYLAVQCCEHLNRAIVVERAAVPNAEQVNAVPQKKAGGSLATKAYHTFKEPVLVESIKADAGIDIGGTLIGMHLKQVAVPVRLSVDKIGQANIICARTRPKFIGGERAVYDENLL
ncbi:MAG: TIGR01440 family protein [Candidatus Coproplasma sp.]